jgi:hypothetical protein
MSESSMGPVQAAVYAVLAADATLLALVDAGAILDSVPEPNKLKKYLLIGESLETPQDTFGSYGREELLTLHVLVEDTQDAGGWKRAKDIDARIIELLDGAELTVAGRAFVYCNFDHTQTLHDPPWRHIATDFRIATEAP